MEAFMFNVDFNNPSPQVICHPNYEPLVPGLLEKLKPHDLRDHFILFSSGTTGGGLKGYALSKKALFENAKAVNHFFNLTQLDTWALSLPLYHVGGLSVLMRAELNKNKVIDARNWDPLLWRKTIEEVTVTSIVPTQLYDLVKHNITSPRALKYLMVGGDFLSTSLKKEALKLGWPVIRTFGMSEVCSQLASSKSPSTDKMEILPIHEVKTLEGRLLVKSKSLFTLEFILGDELEVKEHSDLSTKDGFFLTKDRAEVKSNLLFPMGRLGEEFKISGHLVNLNQLKDALYTFLLKIGLYEKMDFLIEKDDRKGNRLILITAPEGQNEDIINEIKELIKPSRIDEIRVSSHLERNALGKLKRN
jgi:O-succinylbenzoic acid--CoA ligase